MVVKIQKDVVVVSQLPLQLRLKMTLPVLDLLMRGGVRRLLPVNELAVGFVQKQGNPRVEVLLRTLKALGHTRKTQLRELFRVVLLHQLEVEDRYDQFFHVFPIFPPVPLCFRHAFVFSQLLKKHQLLLLLFEPFLVLQGLAVRNLLRLGQLLSVAEGAERRQAVLAFFLLKAHQLVDVVLFTLLLLLCFQLVVKLFLARQELLFLKDFPLLFVFYLFLFVNNLLGLALQNSLLVVQVRPFEARLGLRAGMCKVEVEAGRGLLFGYVWQTCFKVDFWRDHTL